MFSRCAAFRDWLPALAAGLLLLLGSASGAPALASARADSAAPLPHPLDVLARSFRAGDPGLLRSLLPGEEKVRVSSPSLGLKTGYYSGDQIYFLFQDIFRLRSTRAFQFLRGAEVPPDTQRLIAVARWTYRKGNSREFTAEISFDLTHRKGGWCIREIREIL
jgi:hypothetical protein